MSDATDVPIPEQQDDTSSVATPSWWGGSNAGTYTGGENSGLSYLDPFQNGGTVNPQALDAMGWTGGNPLDYNQGSGGNQDTGLMPASYQFSPTFQDFMKANNITSQTQHGAGDTNDFVQSFMGPNGQVGPSTITKGNSDTKAGLAMMALIGGAGFAAASGAGAGAGGMADTGLPNYAAYTGPGSGLSAPVAGDTTGTGILGGSGGGLSSSDAAALYGNAGYGTTAPNYLSDIGWGAAKGGGINAGLTAAKGGDFNQVLKAGAIGALGGGVGAGIGDFNPAGSLGIDNPAAAGAVNRGIGGAASAAATGGNPVLGGAAGGAGGAITGLNPGGSIFDNPQLAKYANNAIGAGAAGAINGGNPLMSAGTSAATSGLSMGLQAGAGAINNMGNDNSSTDWSGNSGGVPSWGNNLDGTGQPNMSVPSSTNPMSSYLNGGSSTQPSMDYSSPTDWTQASTVNPNTSASQGPGPVKSLMTRLLGMNGPTASPLSFGGGNATDNSPSQFDNMAGNLMQLYQAHKNAGMYGGLAGNLSSLYTPNSPYAQQLQSTLMRADAASGRRSQAGPRSVELAARLAALNSQNAPELAKLYGAQQNNQGAEAMALLRMGMGGKNGGGMFNTLGGYYNNIMNPSNNAAGGPNSDGFGSGPAYGNQDLGQEFGG